MLIEPKPLNGSVAAVAITRPALSARRQHNFAEIEKDLPIGDYLIPACLAHHQSVGIAEVPPQRRLNVERGIRSWPSRVS